MAGRPYNLYRRISQAIARNNTNVMKDLLRNKRQASHQIQWIAEELSQRASQSALIEVMYYFRGIKQETVLNNLVKRGCWAAVGVLLRRFSRDVPEDQRAAAVKQAVQHASDTDLKTILPHCPDSQLDSALAVVVERQLWHGVSLLLQRTVSDLKRSWALEEAMKHADDKDLDSILPHCAQEQVQTVLTLAVTRGLWGCVAQVLKRGTSAEQHQWAIEEASKQANDHELSTLITKYSDSLNDEQRKSVLLQAVKRGLWESVTSYSMKKVSLERAQREWLVTEACKDAPSFELEQILRCHCEREFVGAVLPDLVRRHKWDALRDMLQSSKVSETQKDWIVLEASRQADGYKLDMILRHCSDRILEDVVLEIIKRGVWTHTIIDRLTEHSSYKVSPHVLRLAVDSALNSQADDYVFKKLIQYSAIDQMNPVFTAIVNRKLWDVLKDIVVCMSSCQCKRKLRKQLFYSLFPHPCYRKWKLSTETLQWGIEEASKRAYETTVSELMSAVSFQRIKLEPILLEAIKRGFWETILVALRRGVSNSICKWTIETVLGHSTSSSWSSHKVEEILLYCPDDQLEYVVTEAVNRKLWTVTRNLLERNLPDAQKRWVIATASQHATDTKLVDMMHHCHEDQLSAVLTTVVQRKLWASTKKLMGRNLTDAQKRWVMENASQHASDSELIDMLHHCPKDQLDVILTTVVKRKLWGCANVLLKREVLSEKKLWAVEQAFRHAPEQTILDVFIHFPFEGIFDSVLAETLKRVLLKVSNTLLLRLPDDQQIGSKMKVATEKLTAAEKDKVVRKAVKSGAWALIILMLQCCEIESDTKRQIVEKVIGFYDRIYGNSVFHRVVQYCEGPQLMTALKAAVDRQLTDTASSILRRIAQHGNPLALTDDGMTVLQCIMNRRERRSREKLVAECITLGISTCSPPVRTSLTLTTHVDRSLPRNSLLPAHRPLPRWSLYSSFGASQRPQTNSSSGTSVLSIAAKRHDLKIVKMLYESGSCTHAELNEVINKDDGTFLVRNKSLADVVSYLESVVMTPRSLKSLCRLVISHHIGVGLFRQERVEQLPLPRTLKEYVLFSDLVNDSGHESCAANQAGTTSTEVNNLSEESLSSGVWNLLLWESSHLKDFRQAQAPSMLWELPWLLPFLTESDDDDVYYYDENDDIYL